MVWPNGYSSKYWASSTLFTFCVRARAGASTWYVRNPGNGNISCFFLRKHSAFIERTTGAIVGWNIYHISMKRLFQKNKFLKWTVIALSSLNGATFLFIWSSVEHQNPGYFIVIYSSCKHYWLRAISRWNTDFRTISKLRNIEMVST